MAIVNATGWEAGTGELTATGMTFDTVAPHSGTYCGKLVLSAGGLSSNSFAPLSATGQPSNGTISTVYTTFYFKWAIGPTTAGYDDFFHIRNTSNTIKLALAIDQDKKLRIYTYNLGTTSYVLVATSTFALTQNEWLRFDVTCGSGQTAQPWSVTLNGTTTWSGTGDLQIGTTASVYWGRNNNGTDACEYYFDDMVVSDSALICSGSTGVGMKRLAPRANGTYTAWAGGTTGTYTDVDEVPHDSDTTYISTSTDAIAESVALDSTATAGLTGKTIKGVVGYAFFRRVSGTTNVALRFRSGSTNVDSTAASLGGVSYSPFKRCAETDPATGSAWTTGGVDAVEVGAVSANAAEKRCTAMGAYVLYALTDNFTAPPAASTARTIESFPTSYYQATGIIQ